MPPQSHPLLGTARGRARTKKAASQRLAALDEQLAEHLPKADLDVLVRLTTDIVDNDEARGGRGRPASIVTGGPAPTAREVGIAQRANLLRGFGLRRALLRDTLTSSEVADLLGSASRQTPHDRVAAGSLLAIKDGGRLRFPFWQFDPEGPDGVVEGLPDVLAALPPLTQLGRIAWFTTPRPGLEGRAPIDALKSRDVARVVAEAAASHAG